MLTDVERVTFLTRERGDRMRPLRRDRTYWVLRLLRDKMKRIVDSELLSEGERLLDYGCGNKPYRELFVKKFHEHIGADIAGNADAKLIISDDGRIPCEDESFNVVLSSQVLEHVADPRIYLSEAFRVLKPGGALILSTHGIWPYHPDPGDYWRWTLDGLKLELHRARFEIMMVEGVFGLKSSALQLWQDATAERLPGILQTIYIGLIQRAIGFIERRRQDKVSPDASVYLILAKRLDHGTDQNVS